MSGADRNRPCACGSGQKSKRCPCREIAAAHLEALEIEHEREHARSWAEGLERLGHKVLHRSGDSVVVKLACSGLSA